jgi:hypothetical protein
MLPEGHAPFGIQAFGDRIHVTCAKQDEEGEDEQAGAGLGVLSVFDTEGTLSACGAPGLAAPRRRSTRPPRTIPRV